MNIVDSSGWLEYFVKTPRADLFAEAIENTAQLLVPTIILYEVFRKLISTRSAYDAAYYIEHMKRGQVIDLTQDLALSAAGMSKEYHLPMADSIIFATADHYSATLWTQDADFKGMPGVKYF